PPSPTLFLDSETSASSSRHQKSVIALIFKIQKRSRRIYKKPTATFTLHPLSN
ncbi:hypothetical protein H6G81_35275, partial [Scytonema hofmannii FACHB-248]|nr:hypothetical protein [Scytonema hofmannii FACHB-248]